MFHKNVVQNYFIVTLVAISIEMPTTRDNLLL